MTFRPLGVLLVALAAFLGGFAAGSGKLPHVAVPHVADAAPRKLAVTFIDETLLLVPGRAEYRNGKAFHDYLKSKGHTWRYGDQDVEGPDGKTPADLAPFIADAKAKGGPPRVYLNDLATGKCLWSGEPPETAAGLIEAMHPFGG